MAQFLGTVIGTKMDKTAKVLVTRMVLHPVIKKVRVLILYFKGYTKLLFLIIVIFWMPNLELFEPVSFLHSHVHIDKFTQIFG